MEIDTVNVVDENSAMNDGDHNLESIKILAWDYSGSTLNDEHYHRHGKRYLDEFSKAFEPAVDVDIAQDKYRRPIYLVWCSKCVSTSLAALQKICEQRKGRGKTRPSTIVSWIHNYIPKGRSIELWLITDGEIDSDELKNCSAMNIGINYCTINFIIINRDQINMSVGASFFRGAELRIFYNESLLKEINMSQPFDYESISIDNFDAKWDNLCDFIQAKFMGSDIESLEEVEKLSALRRRLLDSISVEDDNTNSKYPKFFSKNRIDLIATLKSCSFYKTLISPETKALREKIEARISTLINYIHDKHKSYEFDLTKFYYKEDNMESIEEELEPELENLDDFEKCAIFDIITLEDEESVPVLLLSTTDLIEQYWVNGNFSKFRTVMDCPLMAKLDNCIGHVYTCVPNYMQILASITEVVLAENGEILSKNDVSKLDRTKLLSCCKQYIDLTKILERFPTLREYAQYTWKIKRFSRDKVRLFNPNVVSDIQQYFDLYSNLGVNIDEFISRSQNSIKISKRIKLETTMDNEKKIDKFIKKAKRMLDDT